MAPRRVEFGTVVDGKGKGKGKKKNVARKIGVKWIQSSDSPYRIMGVW